MKLHDFVEVVLKEKGDQVYSISSDATVYDALVEMSEKDIGALVVLDGSEIAGMFSERDYARKVILSGGSSRDMKVHEIMTSPVMTVKPTDRIDECMLYMTKRRCRHLPVIDDGKILGVVSLGDLVDWIIDAQNRAINDLEGYISGGYPS